MYQTVQPITLFSEPTAQASVGVLVEGQQSGPTLVVLGYDAATLDVYSRITALPGITNLRGRLVLACIDEPCKDKTIPAWIRDRLGAIDDSLCLANSRFGLASQRGGTDEPYWTILAKMAGLGMISGRGVSTRRIAEFAPALHA
jgi:hypothetical protein